VVSGFSRTGRRGPPEGGHYVRYVVSGFSRTGRRGPPEGGHHVPYVVMNSKLFAATGSRRIRVPVAAKIAFVSAGATHG